MNETKQQVLIFTVGITFAFLAVFWSLNQEAERVKKELDRRENLYTTLEDEPK